MKEVTVLYDTTGKINSISNDCVFLEGENKSIKVIAIFPTNMEINSINAYLRTNSGKQTYITPTLSGTQYELILEDNAVEKGLLKIGYEIVSGTESIRFSPLTLSIDGFISDDYIISNKLYTTKVDVDTTITGNAGTNASVENIGNTKDVKLKFKVPKGTTFTPSVDDNGNLSWTNDGGLTNPISKNIKGVKGDTGAQGIQGAKGDTGVTGNGISNIVLNSDYTLTINFTNGTTYTTSSIRGAKGESPYTQCYENELDTLTPTATTIYKVVGSSQGTVSNQWKSYIVIATPTRDSSTGTTLQIKNDTSSFAVRIGQYSSGVRTWGEWHSVLLTSDIVDNLTSADTDKALSANQGKVLMEYIYKNSVKKYGVKRLKTSTSPTLTRIWNAEGKTANAGVDTTTVTNDFDKTYPWSHMRRCNISVNSDNKIIINAYEGEPTYKTDGTNGQVAVEIPEFYYCPPDIEGSDYETFGVSEFAIGGWFKSPKMYVGAYTASADGETKLKSISGTASLVNTTRTGFRTKAQATDGLCQLIDMQYINALQLLFTVEFATLNSQSIMMGNVSSSTTVKITGSCDTVSATSGSPSSNSDGAHGCKYRGIENPWGNISQWIDGININNRQAYVCTDKSNFADNTYSGNYIALNYVNSLVEGYVTTFGYDKRYPYVRMASNAGASTATYYCDRYTKAEGECIIYYGSGINGSLNAGLWCLYIDVPPTGAYGSVSTRLMWRED